MAQKPAKFMINYLKQRREEQGLTRNETAELIGCTRRWLNSIENSNWHMHEDYIEILCKAWKLKPWDLIGVKGELEYRAGRNKDLTSSSKKQRKA